MNLITEQIAFNIHPYEGQDAREWLRNMEYSVSQLPAGAVFAFPSGWNDCQTPITYTRPETDDERETRKKNEAKVRARRLETAQKRRAELDAQIDKLLQEERSFDPTL